ncbi:hypothetical protein OHA70_08200 [Kribbella sp. NBC_00382]|uniref:hypothetical protein n=1 Tax=Kribbella sp. NBC_00382 TaxID=2975967 RepID=UPI002E1B103D
MTAQNLPNEDLPEAEAGAETDPLGPIVVPARSRIGSRALALVGTVGLTALGLASVLDGPSTWPTINHL